MSSHRILTCAVAVVLLSTTTSCVAQSSCRDAAPDSICALLPLGELNVQILEPRAPPRADTLLALFRHGVSQNPDWFQQYVREADLAPGELLPYHANMGMSEGDYTEMQRLLNNMILQPTGSASVQVRAQADSLLVLDGGNALPELTGITIDPRTARADTPFGALGGAEIVEPEQDQGLVGPWRGYAWRLDELDEQAMTGKLVMLDLGRSEETGESILYYDARRMQNGNLQESDPAVHRVSYCRIGVGRITRVSN